MCTVTLIPIESNGRRALRMACNRDELRTRPQATPPSIQVVGNRRVLMPIDPVSGGTWIGVNDAGLIATLLNGNPPNRVPLPPELRRSRGEIVPRLLREENAEQAARIAMQIQIGHYDPFRVLVIDSDRLLEINSNGKTLTRTDCVIGDKAHFFTSSGLGDAVVNRPRRALFERSICLDDNRVVRQDEFHLHQWADQLHLSVWMERDDARTVSRTIVTLDADELEMTYHPDASPGLASSTTTLHRTPVNA